MNTKRDYAFALRCTYHSAANNNTPYIIQLITLYTLTRSTHIRCTHSCAWFNKLLFEYMNTMRAAPQEGLPANTISTVSTACVWESFARMPCRKKKRMSTHSRRSLAALTAQSSSRC